jgi:hypothetical protein
MIDLHVGILDLFDEAQVHAKYVVDYNERLTTRRFSKLEPDDDDSLLDLISTVTPDRRRAVQRPSFPLPPQRFFTRRRKKIVAALAPPDKSFWYHNRCVYCGAASPTHRCPGFRAKK